MYNLAAGCIINQRLGCIPPADWFIQLLERITPVSLTKPTGFDLAKQVTSTDVPFPGATDRERSSGGGVLVRSLIQMWKDI